MSESVRNKVNEVGWLSSNADKLVDSDYDASSCLTWHYRKFPKYSDTQNICCNHSKIWTMWLYHRVMSPNDADGMANGADPD